MVRLLILSGRVRIGLPLKSKCCKDGKKLRSVGISASDNLQFAMLKLTKEAGRKANEKLASLETFLGDNQDQNVERLDEVEMSPGFPKTPEVKSALIDFISGVTSSSEQPDKTISSSDLN